MCIFSFLCVTLCLLCGSLCNKFFYKNSTLDSHYQYISNCHGNGGKGKNFKCHLPDRKNFRIMFLPKTDAHIRRNLELLETQQEDLIEIQKERDWIINLKNVIIAHIITGVPLAIIPLNKYETLIESLKLPELDEQEIKDLNEGKNIENLDFTIYKNIKIGKVPNHNEIWSGSVEDNTLQYKIKYSTDDPITKDNKKWENNLTIGTRIFEHIFRPKPFEEINRHDLSWLDPINVLHKELDDNSEMMCVFDKAFCAISFLNDAKKTITYVQNILRTP
jgi:hypothetical protein